MSNNVSLHLLLVFYHVWYQRYDNYYILVISVAAILEFGPTITVLVVQNPAWKTPYLDLGHINTSRTHVFHP